MPMFRGERKCTHTAIVRACIRDGVLATRGKIGMKRIKRVTRVRVLEARVHQGLVLMFMEKQMMGAWNDAMQKADGKGAE